LLLVLLLIRLSHSHDFTRKFWHSHQNLLVLYFSRFDFHYFFSIFFFYIFVFILVNLQSFFFKWYWVIIIIIIIKIHLQCLSIIFLHCKKNQPGPRTIRSGVAQISRQNTRGLRRLTIGSKLKCKFLSFLNTHALICRGWSPSTSTTVVLREIGWWFYSCTGDRLHSCSLLSWLPSFPCHRNPILSNIESQQRKLLNGKTKVVLACLVHFFWA